MGEISANHSLTVQNNPRSSGQTSGNENNRIPDLDQLLSGRPGATREEILKQAERQLRIGLETSIGEELGIPPEIINHYSMDQLAAMFRRALDGIQQIQKFAKGGSQDLLRNKLHRQEVIEHHKVDKSERPKKKKNTPKSERKARRRGENVRSRREAKEIIEEQVAEANQVRGLFDSLSNDFVKLGGQRYSPYDVYGHYIGSEIRALEANTNEPQLGDNSFVHKNDLVAKKKEELASSFVTSTPTSFFTTIFKKLGLLDALPKFLEARKKLVNERYRELKDSFKNCSTYGEDLNWQKILEAFSKELDNRQRANRSPDFKKKLKTRGLASNFVSRVRALWRDREGIVLDHSLAA